MRVTVIHNPKAGEGNHSREELSAALRRAGFSVQYQSIKEDGWHRALREPGDFVVAAGGDGTVEKVAERMAGGGIPLTILPAGTANNIAGALGVNGTLEDLIAVWLSGRRRPFDLGFVRAGSEERNFVETAGVGFFAQTMSTGPKRKARESSEEELRRAREGLRRILPDFPAMPWRVQLDGEDLSGEYLLVEAMNIDRLGPGLRLAPAADPGDGLLDVVFVTAEQRGLLDDYLARRLRGDETPPELTIRRAARVQIAADDPETSIESLRVDDARLGEEAGSPVSPSTTVDIGMRRHALDFLVAP